MVVESGLRLPGKAGKNVVLVHEVAPGCYAEQILLRGPHGRHGKLVLRCQRMAKLQANGDGITVLANRDPSTEQLHDRVPS